VRDGVIPAAGTVGAARTASDHWSDPQRQQLFGLAATDVFVSSAVSAHGTTIASAFRGKEQRCGREWVCGS